MDVAIQAGIGRFFAYKLRSAVLWSLYRRTGEKAALTEAVKACRMARQAWASMAEIAKPVYASDVTYGLNANMRGHWIDRIAGIDGDLSDMERQLNEAAPEVHVSSDAAVAQRAIRTALARPRRPQLAGRHTPAANLDPGKPLQLPVSFPPGNGRKVDLLYRRADQSQRWRKQELQVRDGQHHGSIPSDYTGSPYPMLYYFEVHEPGGSGIYPGFGPDLSNQPYYLVRSNRLGRNGTVTAGGRAAIRRGAAAQARPRASIAR